MKKGIALIAMLLAAVVMLSGCNLIGYDAELDGAQVVAKVNDTEITKNEWLAYRDYLIEYEMQYMQQYYGMTMPVDEAMIASYGEAALEQLIESEVVEAKMTELGIKPLSEEDAAEVETYANEMVDLYKMILRFQNHPEIETVEEEQERLAAEENPGEPVATMTDAELDAMLAAELEEVGYTYDYFSQTQTNSVLMDKIYEHTGKDVAVTDEQVKAEFDSLVEEQKAAFDANAPLYASYESNAMDVYYVPAGYRGVKNLLVSVPAEKQSEIDALQADLTAAQNMFDNGNEQLEALKAEDTSELDEEAMKLYEEQKASYEQQIADAQAEIDALQPQVDAAIEAAFAEILPTAQEALAKAQAGEDFDALVETYGGDTGMTAEPAKSRGYLVCEGLAMYVPEFQDAAMALANVGDVSAELVKTDFGYHILQYATDIPAGAVEYTDEIKTSLYNALETEAKDAAFEAAVAQWVSAATVKTFPKVME